MGKYKKGKHKYYSKILKKNTYKMAEEAYQYYSKIYQSDHELLFNNWKDAMNHFLEGVAHVDCSAVKKGGEVNFLIDAYPVKIKHIKEIGSRFYRWVYAKI
jgi:hypothetical protein